MKRSYSTSRFGPGILIDEKTRDIVYDRLKAFGIDGEPDPKGRFFNFGYASLLNNMGPQPEFVLSSRFKSGLDRVARELGLPLE